MFINQPVKILNNQLNLTPLILVEPVRVFAIIDDHFKI
jgi:hypothetical protein